MLRRERGPFDGEFEHGHQPMDEPPGFEEREYWDWKEAGGVPFPHIHLASRRPQMLTASGHRELARAVPVLRTYCFFQDARTALQGLPPGLDWLVDAAHWLPTDVYGLLCGIRVAQPASAGGQMMVYTTEAAALKDLVHVWGLVRGQKGARS